MRGFCSIALVLALAGAAACGPSEPEPAAPPLEPPPPAIPAVPAPAVPPQAVPQPGAGGEADVERGARIYASHCAACHGADGKGDGPLAAGLDPQPTNHADAAYMDTLSDEHLFLVVKEGGSAVGASPLMAPWGGTLSDAEIRDVVAFTRSLSR
jgi:mono/diheme cytochrome c family protein